MKTTDNYLIKSYDNKVKIKRVIETVDRGNLPLIPQATPDNLKKIPWLDQSFLSGKRGLEIVIQLFVIKSNDKVIIVDTCIGNHKDLTYKPWANKRRNFLDKIKAAGIIQTKVDYVVCTHIHLDHIGWNTTKINNVWKSTFPNASYIFSLSGKCPPIRAKREKKLATSPDFFQPCAKVCGALLDCDADPNASVSAGIYRHLTPYSVARTSAQSSSV